ncbi:MAG TPA: phosphoribosyltransferase family protein, partial [Candidatus Paceibacterota bacterium]|nr:phosphoribosyltransferase family protein [Candidatus Paceibacterota bacterium]
MFKDRTEAGKLLAKELLKYRGGETVVLALPRGGVVVGYEVARALHSPLDIVVTRKIGHPHNPEYAVCAVNKDGLLLCDEQAIKSIDYVWLNEEISSQKKEAERRILLYREGRRPEEISGKIAILVDDGIATGLTMRLAIRYVRTQKAKKIVVAVPVAPLDFGRSILNEGADEIITLIPPEDFMGAIGA